MYKRDLRDNYPDGLFTAPRDELIRYHVSSGTTGKPTVVGYTKRDIENWSESLARGFSSCGLGKGDVFQVSYGYGLFTGGLGFHYAGELLGCMTIPASSGNTERQIHLMQSFGTTVLHIIPSYALRVLHFCDQAGIAPSRDLSVRVIFVGGEPHSEQLRRRIEEGFGAKVYNCYGLSEMAGPGIAMECMAQDGMHLCEDQYLLEVLDPETLEPVEEGQIGEVVLTTLRREANPLIRYRTRDMARLLPAECACGSAHRRLSRMEGRTDDMLVVRGVNVYPMQVERALLDVDEVGRNYVITLDRPEDLDRMSVAVELTQEAFTDDMRELNALQRRIERRLQTELDISVCVELHEPGELPVSDGKAVRVIDNRDQEK
ncbi:MAG TPA: phenylacetate--CoA ligase [Armatimonadetes bacterium]|nr:phenylacetate--CoA ligase [Armatimonadota bacterium]